MRECGEQWPAAEILSGLGGTRLMICHEGLSLGFRRSVRGPSRERRFTALEEKSSLAASRLESGLELELLGIRAVQPVC